MENQQDQDLGAAGLLQQAITAIQNGAVTEERVNDLIDKRLHAEEGPLTSDRVRQIFAESLSKAVDAIPPKEINIDLGAIKTQLKGKHTHPVFETVLRAVAAGCYPLLIGPAGSGKSTIARQVSEALQRAFYSQGPATSEYKYLGFVDAHGKLVETPLHTAYRDGGLFCAEEIDSSSASALVAGLNMVLANGRADFGNAMVERHENFCCIATANTWGSGADRLYVGRNQLDAATLDRFVTIHVDYDTALERAVAQHDKWVDFVQAARSAATELKIRCVISPRASIQGANMLRAGIKEREVAMMTVWRGMDDATVAKIKAEIKRSKGV